jgi:RNA polymerase sigma-70 factor (ECF subfamily)
MDDVLLTALVRAAQSGDRDAFGELVREFEPMVLAVTLRRLRNTAEAHEVTQDVFVRVLRKLGQLREPERFVGWLKRIAVRQAINRAVRRPPETTAPETIVSLKAQPDLPLDSLLRTERASHVRGGLARLRPLDRETLLAFYFRGESLKEMSDRFDCPIGTIKRRLHTARNRLKERLSDLQLA